MADETITQPAPTPEAEPSRAQERITELSEKVRIEAEARTAAETAKAEAEKRAAFAEGYADFVSNNPAAKEFKAQIQEKVMAGMSVEDAGFAILGKAGKLGAPATAPQAPVAGGSAAIQPPQQAQKNPSEMTQEERRKQLEKELQWA
jgi:hypothetical protein